MRILGEMTRHPELGIGLGVGLAFGGGVPPPQILSSPTDVLTVLNALSGNQYNKTIYLTNGVTYTAPLYLNGVANLTIDATGAGAAPIISNMTTVSSANWQDYTATQANTYYITTANWGAARCAVVMSAGGVDYPCYERSSIADLLLVYERASTGASHQWTYYYDSGASRMYIHVDSAVAANIAAVRAMTTMRPRTSGEETVQSGDYGAILYNCTNVTIKNVTVQGGRTAVCATELCNGVTWSSVTARWPGNENGKGQNLFQTKGSARATPDQNITISNCVGRDAYGSNNNAVEILYSNNLTITESDFYDFRGNGVEFWQTGTNVTVKRSRFRGGASLFTMFDRDGDNLTNHAGVLFQNVVYSTRPSYLNKGSAGGGSPTGGAGCVLSQFADNRRIFGNVRVINCTFHLDDNAVAYDYRTGSTGAGTGTFKFKNNVVIWNESIACGYAGYEQHIYTPDLVAQAALWTIDRNVYQFGRDTMQATIATNFVDSALSQCVAFWNGVTGATTNEDNSAQPTAATNLITTNGTMASSVYTPYNGSASMVGRADTGDADYPTVDYTGATRSRASSGAYD